MNNHVFVSYRNVPAKDITNFEFVKLLNGLNIFGDSKQYIYHTFPPETLPKGTMFTPFDIAEFIHKTIVALDSCDHFLIIENDYYDESGEFTSMWTEAEYACWSFYDRKFLFGRWKNKEKCYWHIKRSESEISVWNTGIVELSKYQIQLLLICSSSFDKYYPGRSDYRIPYLKYDKYSLVVCAECGKLYLGNRSSRASVLREKYTCTCGNTFSFSIKHGQILCIQSISNENMNAGFFNVLALLVDGTRYDEFQLYV